MEILFDGIPLEQVTTSMTINGPAAVIWAMYIAAAEKQGVPMGNLRGTLQNDILKEYQAQKEFLFPPEPSMRLVIDTIEFGTRNMPYWNTISISGYHIREAGSTAAQELAFTLGNGMEYVRWSLERGLAIDEFAPRLSFFFNQPQRLLRGDLGSSARRGVSGPARCARRSGPRIRVHGYAVFIPKRPVCR